MCDINLIYGYGVSGISAVQLLLARGKKVAVFDDDFDIELPNNVIDMRGKSAIAMLEDVTLLVTSPSVMDTNDVIILAKSMGIEVVSELELGFRNCNCDIVAITGTNGKTTSTLLMQKLLEEYGIDAHAVGNIGVGFCSEIPIMNKDSVAVVEVSSYQLSGVELFAPKIAICLNISPDHIEYHRSMEKYIECKSNIFKCQCCGDYSVFNYDDETVRNMSRDVSGKVYYYSTCVKVVGTYIDNGEIYFNDGYGVGRVCSVSDIKMLGEHNISNALAVITAGKILNIPNFVIKKVLNAFNPPAYRITYIGEHNNIKIFNDSKSTNIDSTLCASRAMEGETVLILGGYDKGLSYTEMFRNIPENITNIVVFGANCDNVIDDASVNSRLVILKAEGIENAVEIALNTSCNNVLFSPATSSYDMFDNYIQRGEYFNKIVRMFLLNNTYKEVLQ